MDTEPEGRAAEEDVIEWNIRLLGIYAYRYYSLDSKFMGFRNGSTRSKRQSAISYTVCIIAIAADPDRDRGQRCTATG